MELKERIRLARDLAGLSQQALARRVGVSRAAITQWESGQTKNLDAENFLKTARALKVRPEWLLFEEGPMEDVAYHVPDLTESVIELIELAAAASPEQVREALEVLGYRRRVPQDAKREGPIQPTGGPPKKRSSGDFIHGMPNMPDSVPVSRGGKSKKQKQGGGHDK